MTTSATQIRVYDNRLVIINEGILPDEIKIEDLKIDHLSKPRNTLIAEVFYKAGFIESWGRGTLKILSECKNEGLPEPEFESRGHQFSITFRKTDLKTDLKITDFEEQIIKIILSDEKTTIQSIAVQLGKGITVTKDYIKGLKNRGIIKRVGPAKGGHWEVIVKL